MLLSLCVLAGCGGAAGTTRSSVPAYVAEPFTREQLLVQAGARLIVADGCAACHLSGGGARVAPSFESLAGHSVELTDGRRVLVDERLVTEALRHPAAVVMAGYGAGPMERALRRAHLDAAQIEQLAAFIEQVGPE